MPRPSDSTMHDANRKAQPTPQRPSVQNNAAKPAAQAAKKGSNNVVAHAVGAGVGAVAGVAGGAVLTGMKSDNGLQFEHVEDPEEVEVVEVDNTVTEPVQSNEVIVEQHEEFHGNVPLAHGVNDNMSFAQAFSAARAEVGPGGVFHWHGQSYNTYTAAEWNSMSSDQQMAFGQAAVGAGPAPSYAPTHNYTASTSTTNPEPQIVNDDDDVVILGVVHDDETGHNVGAMSIQGQDVVVVDVDGDMEFDVLLSDLNGDGVLQDDEIMDIRGEGLSVASLGGFSDGTDNLYASNDEPDYTNDANV